MEIQKIIENLYINKNSNWLQEINEDEIEPVVIQLWLVHNDYLREQVRWLDKYVYTLPPKMYLSLAWSIIPKTQKVPNITDWLKLDEKTDRFLNTKDEWDFILKKIRKQYKLSDNDYKCVKTRLIKDIKNNLVEWFKYYGVEKRHWKDNHLDFDKIKEGQIKKINTGLGKWGM